MGSGISCRDDGHQVRKTLRAIYRVGTGSSPE